MHGATSGEWLLSVSVSCSERLMGVSSDGAPSIFEKNWTESGDKRTNKIPNFYVNFTASSTKNHFVEKFEHVMKVVGSFVNLIQSH
jgi:hypothetical protein